MTIVRVALEVDGVPGVGRSTLAADEDPHLNDDRLLSALDAALTQAFASAAALAAPVPLAPSVAPGVVELSP